MDGQSLNITQDLIAMLKAIIPKAFEQIKQIRCEEIAVDVQLKP